MDILEAGSVIGTARVQKDGLYWIFSCRTEADPGKIRRLFAQKAWQVEYLGIPDGTGELRLRIPVKRLPEGADAVLSMGYPKNEWLPWQGVLDGVSVGEAYVRKTPEGLKLALPAEQTVKFPAWAEIWKIDKVFDREMAVICLTEDGHLPVIDRETGGDRDEKDVGLDFDLELLDEPAAHYSNSDGTGNQDQRGEADCPDL